MKIKISRHAKRRMKLYKIPESEITDILSNINLSRGEHEILKEIAGFKYPIKIVVSVEDQVITLVTSYPLKKGRKK